MESVAKVGFSDTFVHNAGEALGVASLPEDAVAMILDELNFRVKALVEQAKKFTEHGRRHKMTGDDFDRALRVKNVEPLYGFSSPDCIPFRFSGGGGRDLHALDEREVELNQILNSGVPKAPLEIQLKAHWLAVDGVQPAIPENPAQVGQADEEETIAQGRDIKKRHIRKLRRTEMVQVRSMTTHDLSVEQQLYFKEITEACVGGDETKRAEALQSLSADTGLNAVLPRLVVFISEGVKCNVVQHNLALLIYLMRMVKSLVDNPSVTLEKYVMENWKLHDLLPAILSCILSKQLCARPDADNHWALRDFAGRLLVSLTKSYESSVSGLQNRVIKVISSAWHNDNSPPAIIYGALYVLQEMGVGTVRSFVLPRVPALSDRIRMTLDGSLFSTFVDKSAMGNLQSLLIKVLVHYVKTVRPSHLSDIQDFRNEFGTLGVSVFQEAVGGKSRIGSTGGASSSSRPPTPGTQHRPAGSGNFASPQNFVRQQPGNRVAVQRSSSSTDFFYPQGPTHKYGVYGGGPISPDPYSRTSQGSQQLIQIRNYKIHSSRSNSPASSGASSPVVREEFY